MAGSQNDMEQSDEDLMALIQNGDHRAFTILVRRHMNLFYSAALRMTGPHQLQDAQDIVQEAFIKLWVRPDRWDQSKGVKFTTWFYKVITNLALDHMRKKRPDRMAYEIEAIPDERIGADQEMIMNEQQRQLELAIQTLPDRQRAALNLCVYEGLSQKDAAQVLGVGVKALESLLSRAKAGVQDYFAREQVMEKNGDQYGS